MQTIGSLLKAERLKLRLTQKQMAAGVISTSFYSKVENDINDINAKDLISILELNKISVPKFMSQVSIQQKKSESMASIEQRLYSAFFQMILRQFKRLMMAYRRIQWCKIGSTTLRFWEKLFKPF